MAVFSDEVVDLRYLNDYGGYQIIDEYGGFKLIKTRNPNRYMAVKDSRGEIVRQRTFTSLPEAVRHWRNYCMRSVRDDPGAIEELQHKKILGYYL